MKFSIYSELQHWPGKSHQRLYDEVLEQITHADRLGFYGYAIIEHFFFPKFSASANPLALFAAAAQRTKQIRFRTLGHVLPYHNPTVLASQIAMADALLGERYEFGAVRGHGWLPTRAGVAVGETRDLYEESLQIVASALETGRVSFEGKHFSIDDTEIVPRATRKFRIFAGGTSNRTYELAAERGWAVAVPPLLSYADLKDQLDLYRAKCAEFGTQPDIVWIHACHLDENRETAQREGERWLKGFLAGNASPLTEGGKMPPADELAKAGYGFYASGILEGLAQMPYAEMLERDIVWAGTPADVIERIEGLRNVCEGLTEVSITVNAGGAAHWQAIKTQEIFADRVMPHFRRS